MAPPPADPPNTPEAEFLRQVLAQIDKTWEEREPVYDLFRANLDKLNEALIDAIPQVFEELLAKEASPSPWQVATFFDIFGKRIWEFPLGDRAVNIEASIVAYEVSLQIRTQADFPESWAMTQNNLGTAYSDRIRGDRAENLESAIAAYEAALQVYTRDAFPQEWATTQNNLAIAYRNRIRGDRAENLEAAIAAYQAALQVYARDAFPQDWAMTQNNLGNAYKDRIRGDRAENLESAIAAYQAALQVRTRDAFPQQWATTQNNLGNAYSNRIQGDRAENLESAIAAYQAALQVRTRDTFPQDWAMTQNNLGNAYSNRIQGDRAENLESAIAAYQAALQVYARDTFPQDWAMTQNNLGTAYLYRIRGDRAENLESAIAAYQAALQVYTRDAFPQNWALTQGVLVSALLEHSKLTQNADDLDEAIAALEEAGTVAIPGTDSYVWIQRTLGNALDYRFSLHNDPANLRQAAAAYRRAAETTPWDGAKLDYYEKSADSLYQLGVALTQDGQWYEGIAALEASHAAYRDAHSRLGRADALQQMGRTHYLMSNFDKARIHFRDALRLYDAEDYLPGQAACHAGLGRLMLRLNFIDDAIAHLHQACDLYTQLDDQARLSEVQQVFDLAEKVKAKQPLAATLSPPSP